MEYVQAQFSLKFEPQIRIRRSANQIEDILVEYYGTPQTMPIPDDFAAEAPRIILNSKGGHSQISFSQISVDLTVNFDGEYRTNFELTKQYIIQRLDVLKNLLRKIDITRYYFSGVSYNIHLDTAEKTPAQYMADMLGDRMSGNDLYEASKRVATVKGDRYFINEQVGTFKEYQSKGNSIPNLLDFNNSILVAEGVNLTLDVNDRYQYLCNGLAKDIDEFDDTILEIYQLIEDNLTKWR